MGVLDLPFFIRVAGTLESLQDLFDNSSMLKPLKASPRLRLSGVLRSTNAI